MRLRFTTAGESHGKALVAIVEGLPAGLPVSADWVDRDLARRMQGYGRGARMKIEKDRVEWLAGIRAGETLGSPVAMLIPNRDWSNWEDVMSPDGDGETAVIGGLTVTEVKKSRSGIPLLSSLPLVGKLFSYSSDEEKRRDLIILVTPRIIDDGQPTN